MSARHGQTWGKIRKIVDRIRARVNPEKIILFGSHARGVGNAESDVDLLIVMPVVGSKRDKAVEIGVLVHDIRIAKDIIVITPEDFRKRKNIVGTIERPAAREGKVLYARA